MPSAIRKNSTLIRGGAKGVTTEADVTSTSQGVDRNALDVQIRTSAGVVVDSFGGGTQYTEGATQASPIGTAAMARTAANLVKSLKLDASDNLLVNVAAGGTAGQQYADGAARGTATGTLLMVDDGTLIQSALGTAAGVLKVDISATTANATAIKVDNSAVTQPVSGTVTINALTNASVVKAQLQDNAGAAIVLGQQLAAAAIPIVLTAAQITTLTPLAAVQANAGTNLNTSLLALETTQVAMSAKLPATLGQKTMTASMAVVLPSDQASIPVAATLSAETTKVIGTINLSAAQTLATVTTVGAVTAITNALPTGANVIGQVTANAGTNLNTSALALDTSVNTLLKPASTLAAVTTVTTVSAVTAITNALPAGANIIGNVRIDQTTPGTTNATSTSHIGATVVATGNGVAGLGVQRMVAAREQTYRASTIIPLVAAITANVPFLNIIGSATKTVTVKKITISGMTQTAVGYFAINIEKLSTASTLGTSTTLVATSLDTNNNAVTAVVKAYTVAPTKGALVGTLRCFRALWQATPPGAGVVTDYYDFMFADTVGSGGVVLRGVAQELALVFPVALATAGTLSVCIEWNEE